CTLRGESVGANSLRQSLRTLARRAGIQKRVHPHGFRHTHAYELMMEGIPMPIIQRQLGHVSLATTDRYLAHIAPKQVIETMAKREWSP
ncbi:MAG: site-specific integrase, partial [Actinomycetota bacterium]|nr:site-specific integrase [Actinomycetota bacterium]